MKRAMYAERRVFAAGARLLLPAMAFAAGLIMNVAPSEAQIAQKIQVLNSLSLSQFLGQAQTQLYQLQAQQQQAQSQLLASTTQALSQGLQQTASLAASLRQSASSVAQDMSSMVSATRAMSCPVFTGEGTLLGEDSCVWAKAVGQRTRQFSIDSNNVAYLVGGQKEVAPDWFVGGSLGGGSSWSQTDSDVSSQGQSFEGSVALKHTMGPWLLAGALAARTSTTQTSRASANSFASPVLTSNSSVYWGAGDLRVSYDFAFDGWYVRPRFDFGTFYMNAPGFQESGQSLVALAINTQEHIGVALVPMVEVGGRFRLGATTILRPYLAGGFTYLPDSSQTISGSFVGPLAVIGSFQDTSYGPNVIANFEAGVQLYEAHGAELKVEYQLSAGGDYLNQSLGLRGAWHF